MSQEVEQSNRYKELPRSLEAEHDFLGALILDGKLLEKVRENLGTFLVTSPKKSINGRLTTIYTEILNRAAVTEDFNATVLSAALEEKGLLEKAGGIGYIAGLVEQRGPSAAIVEYAKIIRDTSRRRKLIKVSERIQKGTKHRLRRH